MIKINKSLNKHNNLSDRTADIIQSSLAFLFLPLAFLLLTFSLHSQTWTVPVNISQMQGLERVPDITIDKNNTIHCVWEHQIESNFTKIYYAKSEDDGITWSTPEDISQNTEKWMSEPNIIADSYNNLFVTYDYNIGSPTQSLILMKQYNDPTWSSADTVSEGMPESHGNVVLIDSNDRIYCFWGRGGSELNTYYRYLEEGDWSEIICPYPGNHYLAIADIVADAQANLHAIGAYHSFGQSHYEDKVVYLQMEKGTWASPEILSPPTYGPGKGIDVDSTELPHIAWRQKTPLTGPSNDSTLYSYYDSADWTVPELVVEDPTHQKIVIDENDRPNILDVEKTEEGSMLVHHYMINNEWEGYIVDESEANTFHYALTNDNNKLYVVYLKPDENGDGEIYFSKTGIITYSPEEKNEHTIASYNTFPNPFQHGITICFKLNKTGKVRLNIYNMNGQLIKTLLNAPMNCGNHSLTWTGVDQNGNIVPDGVYLLRIITNKYIITRSICKTK